MTLVNPDRFHILFLDVETTSRGGDYSQEVTSFPPPPSDGAGRTAIVFIPHGAYSGRQYIFHGPNYGF